MWFIIVLAGLASCRRRPLSSNVRPLKPPFQRIVVSPKPKSGPHATSADTTAAVDALMSALVHPYAGEVETIRQVILGAAPGISEGIKWKSPSFRTHEYFATVNLREKIGIGVILHLGAKVKDIGPGGIAVPDPEGLLSWLAPGRACVRFASAAEVEAKKAAFAKVVRNWVGHV